MLSKCFGHKSVYSARDYNTPSEHHSGQSGCQSQVVLTSGKYGLAGYHGNFLLRKLNFAALNCGKFAIKT